MGRRDHGDGGIDERGENRWRLRWRVGGKRYSKSFQGTKRAAQTELRRLLKSADDGAHVAPDRITLTGAGSTATVTCRRRPWNATASLPSSRSSRTLGRSYCRTFGRRKFRNGMRRC